MGFGVWGFGFWVLRAAEQLHVLLRAVGDMVQRANILYYIYIQYTVYIHIHVFINKRIHIRIYLYIHSLALSLSL
jgi:hypothetical protein